MTFIVCILYLPSEYSLLSFIIAPLVAWAFIPRAKNQTVNTSAKSMKIEPPISRTIDENASEDSLLSKEMSSEKSQTRVLGNFFSNVLFLGLIGIGSWYAYGWYQSSSKTPEEIPVSEADFLEKEEIKVVITGHNAGLYSDICMPLSSLLLRIPKDTELNVINEKFVWGGGMLGFPMYFVKYGETEGWMSSQSIYDAPEYVLDETKQGKCQVR